MRSSGGLQVRNRMPQHVESAAEPGRPALPLQLLSIDELLLLERCADLNAVGASRPRLRKPAGSSGAAAAAGGRADAGSGAAGGKSPAKAVSDLPAGWVAMKDEEGDIFYYNQSTGVAQWDKPGAIAKPKTAAAPAPAAAASKFGTVSTASKFGTVSAAKPAVATSSATGTKAVGAAGATAAKPAAAAAAAAKPAAAAAAPAAAPAPAPAPAPADDGICREFSPNPFKPDMCKTCRKSKSGGHA